MWKGKVSPRFSHGKSETQGSDSETVFLNLSFFVGWSDESRWHESNLETEAVGRRLALFARTSRSPQCDKRQMA